MVAAMTPTDPTRCTQITDNAIFTPAATIDSTACARVRFSAASRHDSNVIQPLMSAHVHMATNNGQLGTAAAPTHSLISPRPNNKRNAAQTRLKATMPHIVRANVRRIQA